jgi:hypothetical protein
MQIIFKNYSYLKPLTKLWLFVSIGNPRWLNLWEKYFKITQILNIFFLQIYRNRLNLNCTWIVIGLLFYFLCESKIQVNWHHRTLFNYGNMKKSISQKPQTCMNNHVNDTGSVEPLVIRSELFNLYILWFFNDISRILLFSHSLCF